MTSHQAAAADGATLPWWRLRDEAAKRDGWMLPAALSQTHAVTWN